MKHTSLPFTKMHGLGNDFIIVNALSEIPIPALADRHTGIGFDQLLLIEPGKQADYFCRIFNADGSEAEQCGNGLRCVARYLYEEGIQKKPEFSLETIAGIFPVSIRDNDHIRITMGAPLIQAALTQLPLINDSVSASIISTGNPHAIIKVPALENLAIQELGNAIANHVTFKHGANVGFLQVMDTGHARLRTYERGAGETLACGSNACAAAVAGILNGWLSHTVEIAFRLGHLTIEWEGEGKPIHMTGPAARVYTGYLVK